MEGEYGEKREGEKGRGENVQIRTLLCVHDSGDGNTKVGDWTPEIWKEGLLVID